MQYQHLYQSPLGIILMTSDGSVLTGLRFVAESPEAAVINPPFAAQFHTQDEQNRKNMPSPESRENLLASENSNPDLLPVFRKTVQWLDIYFAGESPSFTPPLCQPATPFRETVYEIIRDIPYGKTMTYAAVAAEIAKRRNIEKMSARAVGNALANNPILLLIPCHRVIGTDGRLTGYAGGIEKKAQLLAMELRFASAQEQPDALFV